MLLAGKKALVIGVANQQSLAWGVASAFYNQGARLGITFLNDAYRKRSEPLTAPLKPDFFVQFDANENSHYEQLRKTVQDSWGSLDVLVHSIAFASTEELRNRRFIETSSEGFRVATHVSCYSLIALCNSLHDLFVTEGSVIAMTYEGSQRVVPNYKVMGVAKAALESSVRYLAEDLGSEKRVRVNAISSGPIRTFASSAIPGIRDLIRNNEERCPLRSALTIEDVGGVAVFLASPLSRMVTGQVIFVDGGDVIKKL